MGAIPPFIQQIIGVLVRAVVVWLAGYLAANADITLSENQIGQVVTYLVPVVAVLAWSLYQKYRGRLKYLTAAASRHVMTEHEVEAIINDPAAPNPSVLTPKDQLPR
jgi:hypothetical protein